MPLAPKNQPRATGVDKNQFFMMNNSVKPTHRATTRDPMGAYVYPTGLVYTNVAGAEVVRDQAVDLKLDPKQIAVILGGDETNNQVLVYLVDPLTAGAVAVREDAQRKTLTMYLHELFAAKPSLRPDQARWCAMRPDVDTDGIPCLLISLRVALEPRRTKRKAAPPPPAGS